MKGRDSLMKKLLSAPNIHGTVSSAGPTATYGEGLYNVPSPANDAIEENCTKLSKFLSQLAKECGREINMVMLDHAYSKPGDWSPENTYLKPTKKLFMFNFSPTENFWKSKDGIDVAEEPRSTLTPPYNKEIASRLMRECEAFVKSIRHEDKGDDWEEKIDKSNWTPQQTRLFSKAVRALNQDRLSRLLCEGSPSEAVKRRVVVDTTARRLRQLLANVNWETRLVQWLHTTLVDTLSNAYLAAYLDALQMPASEDEWSAKERVFSRALNFPLCLEAMDGNHIVLQCPAASGSEYYNYKGTFSIVLLATVDANYNFLYADVGCQGLFIC